MKMFNKVYATFSGTIDKVLVPEGGGVVRKGQPLFKVTPDERIIEEDPEEKRQRILNNTDSYLARLGEPRLA
jgi:pyruvate/2-oxoglutarate dehydrogenase complex dihydrolipoamide acyltransferase (E2) component